MLGNNTNKMKVFNCVKDIDLDSKINNYIYNNYNIKR
jgi:hypothetical protein